MLMITEVLTSCKFCYNRKRVQFCTKVSWFLYHKGTISFTVTVTGCRDERPRRGQWLTALCVYADIANEALRPMEVTRLRDRKAQLWSHFSVVSRAVLFGRLTMGRGRAPQSLWTEWYLVSVEIECPWPMSIRPSYSQFLFGKKPHSKWSFV